MRPSDTLKVYPLVQSAAQEEVSVVGYSTPEDRSAAGRKHAIDLDLFEAKRPRTASSELQTSVAKARSMFTEAVDDKVRALLKNTIDDFVCDKIDAAALESRKAAARAQAEKEHPQLSKLQDAFEAYTAAVDARVAAEDTLSQLQASEDKADANLRAVVRALLPSSAAGPSGCVKSE